MKLLSIQVGLPRDLGNAQSDDPFDRPWRSGFNKAPVCGEVQVSKLNIEGDGQADLEHHGGPDKAINVYPAEHLPTWEEELGIELPQGSFGENLTTSGLLESEVCIGDIFRIGKITVQISQPRQPCWKLARRWRIKDLAVQVERTGRTGWYFRVIKEGPLLAPAEITLLERPFPQWTVAEANDIMHRRKKDAEASRALADCAALSASWKTTLSRRAAKIIDDDSPRLQGG
ncbi:MAG: MOSC domain-containing protein [Verrucomicrobiales bacterium]|nr:MOSC domain-containing protein [Verrucomicrobiales bacterium]